MDLITQRIKLMDAFPDKAGLILQKYGLSNDAEFIRKGLVPEGMEFNDGEQSVVSVITTGSPDRDKEIVSPDGCIATDWNANPVVLWCHDYKQLPLGRGWLKSDNGKIVGKTIYANHPFAKQVYEYRKDGFPLAQSIGFIPVKTTEFSSDSTEGKAGIRRRFDEWIILEYSDVPVPSNPEAITIAVSKGILPQEQAKEYGVDFVEVSVGDKALDTEVTKPGWDETDDMIRHRVREPGLFRDSTFRTVPIKKDKPRVNAVMGKLTANEGKDDDPMVVQNLMFPKADGWDMASAKKWAADNPVKECEIVYEKTYLKITVSTKDIVRDRMNVIYQKHCDEIRSFFKEKLNRTLSQLTGKV